MASRSPPEIVPGTTVFLLENGTGVERVLSFHENASVLPYTKDVLRFSRTPLPIILDIHAV